MSQTWTDTVVSTDNANTVLAELLARTLTLGSGFSGTSLPTDGDLAAGRIALHTDAGGSGFDIPKLYSDPDGGGDGWHGIAEYVHTNVTYSTASANTAGQLIGWGFQRTSSDPTPSANNVGQVIHHTGIGKMKVVESASKLAVVMSGANTDLIPVELPLAAWTLGATPPTANPIGTTPAVPAYLMDATGETLAIGFRAPAGYSGDADVTLRLFFALNVAESAGDDINVTASVRVVQPAASEALDGTSTDYTASKDIGAVTDQYSVHVADIVLTYNDANNPIAAGDWIVVEIHLTNTTTIAAVNFLGGQALFPFGTKVTE